MWSEGVIGIPKSIEGKPVAVHYWVKHYENPSKYGINNGRISKVTLKIDGEVVARHIGMEIVVILVEGIFQKYRDQATYTAMEVTVVSEPSDRMERAEP